TALEDETFEATIIGSDHKEVYNQLEISNMIEARLEEIYELINREIRRLGYYDLRGGYVLTGGTMKMQGALELAQDIFNANARIAIPDYIGVREPQYTVGVGTIQFAYHNAKIQGKNLTPGLTVEEQQQQGHQPKMEKLPKPQKKEQARNKTDEESKQSKVVNFFKSFFE
ncbi:MAG TPA: cell division protein FtsA, partial [Savagea sp.]